MPDATVVAATAARYCQVFGVIEVTGVFAEERLAPLIELIEAAVVIVARSPSLNGWAVCVTVMTLVLTRSSEPLAVLVADEVAVYT